MQQYTIIWEDRWQSGSHWHSMTKKTWVRVQSIHDLMRSKYGNTIRFIFSDFITTEGEKFDPEKVETITEFELNQESKHHPFHD